ncbi:DUF1285 domain-containing protein [Pseudoalteromonas luteoviolacea]|uniref:DUF1285 domain-containing protein n=1 Tax=Pseudoalteromonas luteoviolacea NCIMB 1942 TaxID=1365253 RepID=A0A166XD34_9GAMM|nr:DUF1285 domain-containing protein [Pseudoalteromonas luteoviolacea]KZN40018.1 hypothetical protein N482_21270 [Pseudoalteromonas luteoviolacea NCIMB 1942]KZX01177.1 hypothetical protein JL49_06795 [Pseudoalteromonas luteoviolacea]
MTDKLSLLLQEYLSHHAPTEYWQAGECGVGDFCIDSNGRWFHQGDEIKRLPLARLFVSVLSYDGERYLLKTPDETCTVSVEATPLVIVAWHACPNAMQYGFDKVIICEDNLGRYWPICAQFPLYMAMYKGQNIPHLKLNYGLCARIERNVFYQWVELAEYSDSEEVMLLHSADEVFILN